VPADVPTIPELAERIRVVVGAELAKLERAAAAAPLSEPETRRLRDLAAALRLASVAAPASHNARRAWLSRALPPPDTTEETNGRA
jgi:hypothetical protein